MSPIDYLTTFGSWASAEEVEAQLVAVYGRDRLPGTETRRRSQMGERWCEVCEGALTPKQTRFCSRACSFAAYSGEVG